MIITIICLFIIVVVFVGAIMYTKNAEKNHTLLQKRRIIDSLPNIVSTLGVFFTFLGITIGLWNFNPSPDKIDASISNLLDGLTIAFWTSLAGMFGSLCLRFFVTDKVFDKEEDGISSAEQASINICKEIQKMNGQMLSAMQNNSSFQNALLTEIQNLKFQLQNMDSTQGIQTLNNSLNAFSNSVLSQLQNMDSTQGIQTLNNSLNAFSNSVLSQLQNMDSTQGIQALNNSLNTFSNSVLSQLQNMDSTQGIQALNNSLNTFSNSVLSQLQNMDSTQDIHAINNSLKVLANFGKNQDSNIQSIKSGVDEINSNLSEVLDIENSNVTVFQEQLDETKKFSGVLRSEVDEIETKMTETNELLTEKFDEFSELLKKSNTEALVEVMKKVTEEFQKQMNNLLSRLVKENFEQLNKSVEKLNVWQQENKEMVSKLINQYNQMAMEFEGTSKHLSDVADNTEQLVSNGGKLSVLINQLNKVMIDDKKFIEIASKLEHSASLTQENITKFDESNKSLSIWIQKHKNFVEEVERLIAKLDELNNIRDYSEQFWKDTKKGMDEGVAIIKQGSESLNKQLTDLDSQFYARLSTTLGELDTCIQAMVNNEK